MSAFLAVAGQLAPAAPGQWVHELGATAARPAPAQAATVAGQVAAFVVASVAQSLPALKQAAEPLM